MRANRAKIKPVGHLILRSRLEAVARSEGVGITEALRRVEARVGSRIQIVETLPEGSKSVMTCGQTPKNLNDVKVGCARCGAIIYHSPESGGLGIVTLCAPCYRLIVEEP